MIPGGHFLGGAWVDGEGPSLISLSPHDGSAVWAGRAASADQADAAMQAAAEAFDTWRRTPLVGRIEICLNFAAELAARRDQLTELIAAEVGKARWDADAEVGAMIGKVELSVLAHQERTGDRNRPTDGSAVRVSHRPHGPMVVLGPFNFPGHLPNGHIVPALLAGNTMVFKPSEQAPGVANETVDAWMAAGVPSGVVSVVHGAREVAVRLIDHPATAGVLFTGGIEAGLAIRRRLVERPEVICALELGGNNPIVVWDADDPTVASRVVARSAFTSAGQRCTCARRLIVATGPAGDAVVDAVADVAARLRIGDPLATPPVFFGPLISPTAAEAVLAAQTELTAAGGTQILPVRHLDLGPAYLSAGIIDVTGVPDVPDREIFGPLLQVIRVDDLDAAVTEANRTRFGLAAGIVTDDADARTTFLTEARAGIVNANVTTVGASGAAPFGGIGRSGNHRPAGFYAADYCAYPVASLVAEHPADPVPLPGVDDP